MIDDLDDICGLNPRAIGVGQEIDRSPSPYWKNHAWEWKMKDFELAVSELLDQYRNKIPRRQAADAMQAQLKLLVEDQSWYAEPPQEEPEPEGEPPAAA